MPDRNYISKSQLKEPKHGLCRQNINFSGIMMYLRSIYKLSSEFYWQKREFGLLKDEDKIICEQLFLPLAMFNFSNSEALFKTVNFGEDFARVGIISYVYTENNLAFNHINLKLLLSL